MKKFREVFFDPELCGYTGRLASEAPKVLFGVVEVDRAVDSRARPFQRVVQDTCGSIECVLVIQFTTKGQKMFLVLY